MKKLKIAQVVGVLILLYGVILWAGVRDINGVYFVTLGIAIYATARIWAWIKSDQF